MGRRGTDIVKCPQSGACTMNLIARAHCVILCRGRNLEYSGLFAIRFGVG